MFLRAITTSQLIYSFQSHLSYAHLIILPSLPLTQYKHNCENHNQGIQLVFFFLFFCHFEWFTTVINVPFLSKNNRLKIKNYSMEKLLKKMQKQKKTAPFHTGFILVVFQATLSYKSYKWILVRASQTFKEVPRNFWNPISSMKAFLHTNLLTSYADVVETRCRAEYALPCGAQKCTKISNALFHWFLLLNFCLFTYVFITTSSIVYLLIICPHKWTFALNS